MFLALPHSTLTTSSKTLSGPYPSDTTWFAPIPSIFYTSSFGSTLYTWFLTNPALLQLLNVAFIVIGVFYWKRHQLFKEYASEREKEVEFTLSDLEFKYIKSKNVLIRSKL
jgi:hypothetical protein